MAQQDERVTVVTEPSVDHVIDEATLELGTCAMAAPSASKRRPLCTSTSWWMPLWDQTLAVTASQSPRKNVKEPWSWCACDWS